MDRSELMRSIYEHSEGVPPRDPYDTYLLARLARVLLFINDIEHITSVPDGGIVYRNGSQLHTGVVAFRNSDFTRGVGTMTRGIIDTLNEHGQIEAAENLVGEVNHIVASERIAKLNPPKQLPGPR